MELPLCQKMSHLPGLASFIFLMNDLSIRTVLPKCSSELVLFPEGNAKYVRAHGKGEWFSY